MKKFFLSLFVVFSFIVYTLFQNTKNSPNNEAILSINNKTSGSFTNNQISDNIPSSSNNTNVSYGHGPMSNMGSGMAKKMMSVYKDGSFTGDVTDAYYGNVQVKVTIKNGLISNVQFLDWPQDRSTSREISAYAKPILTREAISIQNANVDTVSGATATSDAFVQSLSSALLLAKN